MSCIDCDEHSIHGAYYRWKNANVEIISCKKHWLEIREVLNKAQEKESLPSHTIPEGEVSKDVFVNTLPNRSTKVVIMSIDQLKKHDTKLRSSTLTEVEGKIWKIPRIKGIDPTKGKSVWAFDESAVLTCIKQMKGTEGK